MSEYRRESEVGRSEFLRRTGVLGIAGASALGFPLLETRAVGAVPLLPPADVIAAGGGATVKIGHIDGFSGVYAAASRIAATSVWKSPRASHEKELAHQVRDRQRRRRQSPGDRQHRSAAPRLARKGRRACRLPELAASVSPFRPLPKNSASFFLAIGTHDTNITGQGAHHVTFRQTCYNPCSRTPSAPALLSSARSGTSSPPTTRSATTRKRGSKDIARPRRSSRRATIKHALGADRLSRRT